MAKQRAKFNMNALNENTTEEKEIISSTTPTPKPVETTIDSKEEIEPTVVEEDKPLLTKMIEELETQNYKAFDSRLVPRSKIILNSKNSYDQEKIDSLAKTILYHRLQHNLSAIYDLESDTYTLESGERRCRSLDLLINKFKEYKITKVSSEEDIKEFNLYIRNVQMFEKGYPCNVQRKSGDNESDEIESEIRLIIANEEVREHDPVKTLEHINRLNELYSKKNENASSDDKVNINKTIAEKLNVTDRQIMNYKKLNNLIPELFEAFKQNDITITDGTNYAKLSEEEQQQILELIKAGKSKIEIKELTEQLAKKTKEVNEKEKIIDTLNIEKDKAMKALEKERKDNEKDIAVLRDNIEKELAENDPNTKLVSDFKNKLNKALKDQEQLQLERKEIENEVTKKDNKINALQEELNLLKDSNEKPLVAKIDNDSKNLIVEESAVKNKLVSCYKEITSLMATIKTYEKNYNKDAAENLGLIDIENIKAEIDRLAKKLKY